MPRAVEDFLNIIPEPWRTWVMIAISIAALIFLAIKSLDKVEQGHLGMRARMGKIVLRYEKKKFSADEIKRQKEVDEPLVRAGRAAKHGRPKPYQPGLTYQIFLVHAYIKVETVSQPYQLDDITVMDESGYAGLVFRQAVVHAFVSDIYLRHMASGDAAAALRSVANTELTVILRQLGYDRLSEAGSRDREVIETRLRLATAARFAELGFELERFDIGTINPIVELATGRAISETGQRLGTEGVADFAANMTRARVARLN